MIYTVTLNPAIDVSLHVKDGLMPGSINRSYGMRTDPGGKGINVSKTLKALGKESVVCIGICGEDGDRLIKSLKADFEVLSIAYPSGNIRTNIKITGENGVTTDINAEGPLYDRNSVEKMKSVILERLVPGDIIVISGRPPLGSPSDIYADLASDFSKVSGVRVILDCSGKYLQKGLDSSPYAVKPNCDELGLENDLDLAMNEANDIVSRGTSLCLISMGKEGAVFADKEGNRFYSKAVDVKVSCTTGCGDSMTAGIAYAADNGMSSDETFRLCMALAAASAEMEGTAPPEKERVQELFDSVSFDVQ